MAVKEYIERETYYQQINDLSKGKHGDYCAAIQDCMTALDEQPAADVREVKHGFWISICTDDKWGLCSNCGLVVHMAGKYKFEGCPHCFAVMDLKERED